jgi:transcriptional regulator with XRE-family HTH domain
MTFAEKLKKNRLGLNLSQTELSAKTGISERTIYSYETRGIMPRSGNIKKLADALNVSYNYLLSDDETDSMKPSSEKEMFIQSVKEKFGQKSMTEARELLTRSAALFAGGELDEDAKDVFFRSLMEVYLESKAEAGEKFSRRRKARTKPRLDI